MAIIKPTVIYTYGFLDVDGAQIVWGPMNNGDVGAPVGSSIGNGAAAITAAGGGVVSGFADKTIAVTGTFGGGGTLALEGSNDGVNFFPLTDPLQNPIAITGAGPFLKEVMEAVIQVRPHVTAGDGTQQLTATMFFRKTGR